MKSDVKQKANKNSAVAQVEERVKKQTPGRKTQAQRREQTQAQVLGSACRLFGEKGYESTSLDDIAVDIGLTIRPIYHYFGNKQQLFLAVTEYMEEQLVASLKGLEQQLHLGQLVQPWKIFLDCCRQPGFVQIVLVDAPHVLGRERWRETRVVETARQLLAQLKPEVFGANAADSELLMRMLMASMAEAALMVAERPDYDAGPLIGRLQAILGLDL
jgi:AcrR family transcriptional regulator